MCKLACKCQITEAILLSVYESCACMSLLLKQFPSPPPPPPDWLLIRLEPYSSVWTTWNIWISLQWCSKNIQFHADQWRICFVTYCLFGKLKPMSCVNQDKDNQDKDITKQSSFAHTRLDRKPDKPLYFACLWHAFLIPPEIVQTSIFNQDVATMPNKV